MKERLKLFGKIGLFWLCFFEIARITFLLYHFDQTATLSFREIVMPLLLGLRMDLAMTGYWLLITGVLFSLPFLPGRILFYAQSFFTTLFLIVSITIVVVDLELYSHWGFRMNTTPLLYISSEAVGSVNPTHAIGMFVILLAMSVGSFLAYRKFIARDLSTLPPITIVWTPAMILITASLFIPIRSSFSVAPLNVSAVYFDKIKSFPNHAGVNVVWNFLNTLSAKDKLRYPDHFFAGDAKQVMSIMEKSTSTPHSLLRVNKPNIIVIILESFTAKIIAPLGGLPDITPNLNALTHEGILFDDFYASGDRTDKGLLAILSGYPAQPQTSMIRFPHKIEHLPFLSKSLAANGYHTSFLYGGDVGFAYMEAYLTSGGFSHITDEAEFSSSLNNSKWGVADGFVFSRLKEQCDTARNPFFKVMLSLSSHEPFEVPMEPVFKGNDERSLFMNACYYTDKSLGEFIAEAKKSTWWESTLIVVTADHGHRFPDPAELKDKGRFKIPMLWLGGALSKRDSVVHSLGGQTDIPTTVLGQLGIDAKDYKFSKNLLDPAASPFAVYVFQNGFGYLSHEAEFVYDFDFNKYVLEKGDVKDQQYGSAYLQLLFDDYNAR